MKSNNQINYEKEVLKVYPNAYGQWAMGRCVITDGAENLISDIIRGTDKVAQNESWKNAYERIHNAD